MVTKYPPATGTGGTEVGMKTSPKAEPNAAAKTI